MVRSDAKIEFAGPVLTSTAPAAVAAVLQLVSPGSDGVRTGALIGVLVVASSWLAVQVIPLHWKDRVELDSSDFGIQVAVSTFAGLIVCAIVANVRVSLGYVLILDAVAISNAAWTLVSARAWPRPSRVVLIVTAACAVFGMIGGANAYAAAALFGAYGYLQSSTVEALVGASSVGG